MKKTARKLTQYFLVFAMSLTLAACASKNPYERKTGDGGNLLRHSSSQSRIDLNPQEQAQFAQIRSQIYSHNLASDWVGLAQKSMKLLEFTAIQIDPVLMHVEAEKNSNVISSWRQIGRALWKTKLPLPAKPDHTQIKALVTIQPRPAESSMLVSVRFEETVWDSNGDAKSRIITEPDLYHRFFKNYEQLIAALG